MKLGWDDLGDQKRIAAGLLEIFIPMSSLSLVCRFLGCGAISLSILNWECSLHEILEGMAL